MGLFKKKKKIQQQATQVSDEEPEEIEEMEEETEEEAEEPAEEAEEELPEIKQAPKKLKLNLKKPTQEIIRVPVILTLEEGVRQVLLQQQEISAKLDDIFKLLKDSIEG